MLTITSVVGNVRTDKKLEDVYQKLGRAKKVERIILSRLEAQRSRMRRVSDAGNDIAITLERGSALKHGDVLFMDANRLIVVEYEYEDVIGFKINEGLPKKQRFEIAIKLGHMIGNLHRSICMKDNVVYIPVHSESEVESIRNIMGSLADHIDVKRAKIVFESDEETKVHAH